MTSSAMPPRSDGARFQPIALLLVGAVLALDALALLIANVINFGVGLPLAIGVIFLLLGWKWSAVQNWRKRKSWHGVLWTVVWTAFALWLFTVGLFFYFISHDHDVTSESASAKAIMILGSGVAGCHASPTLAARLHLGLIWAQRLPAAKVVVTGGTDWGEHCSEGQIMGDYLRAHGLAPQRIVQEERSTTTYENFSMSLPLLRANGIQASDTILIVSSDFHSVRSRHIASKLGYQAIAVVGAVTPLYLRYNAWLREYFSFIKAWALGQY